MNEKELWEQAQELARQNCEEDWDELDKYERQDHVWYEYEKLLKEKEK